MGCNGSGFINGFSGGGSGYTERPATFTESQKYKTHVMRETFLEGFTVYRCHGCQQCKPTSVRGT